MSQLYPNIVGRRQMTNVPCTGPLLKGSVYLGTENPMVCTEGLQPPAFLFDRRQGKNSILFTFDRDNVKYVVWK